MLTKGSIVPSVGEFPKASISWIWPPQMCNKCVFSDRGRNKGIDLGRKCGEANFGGSRRKSGKAPRSAPGRFLVIWSSSSIQMPIYIGLCSQ